MIVPILYIGQKIAYILSTCQGSMVPTIGQYSDNNRTACGMILNR